MKFALQESHRICREWSGPLLNEKTLTGLLPEAARVGRRGGSHCVQGNIFRACQFIVGRFSDVRPHVMPKGTIPAITKIPEARCDGNV